MLRTSCKVLAFSSLSKIFSTCRTHTNIFISLYCLEAISLSKSLSFCCLIENKANASKIKAQEDLSSTSTHDVENSTVVGCFSSTSQRPPSYCNDVVSICPSVRACVHP